MVEQGRIPNDDASSGKDSGQAQALGFETWDQISAAATTSVLKSQILKPLTILIPSITEVIKLGTNALAIERNKEHPGESFFAKSEIEKAYKLLPNGKEAMDPEQLESQLAKEGEYEINFKNKRVAQIHVPEGGAKDRPVIFVIPGCANHGYDPRGYILPEAQVAELAKGKDGEKFVVVVPIQEHHKIGRNSEKEAYAWNVEGALIHSEDVQAHKNKVGYDDKDYFAGLIKLIPQITGANSDYRSWGFVAHSQGTATLHRLAADKRFADKIQNIYAIGGTMEAGDKELGLSIRDKDKPYEVDSYDVQGKNGQRVIVIDTKGDSIFLPHKNNRLLVNKFTISLAKKELANIGLEFVDNIHQDPAKQEFVYLRLKNQEAIKVYRRLGNNDEYVVKAYVAENNATNSKTQESFKIELANENEVAAAQRAGKDIRWVYQTKKSGITVDAYELPTAGHLIPGPGSNLPLKYPGLNAPGIIRDDLVEINKRLKKEKLK